MIISILSKNFILHLSLLDGIGPSTIQKIVDITQRSDILVSDLYALNTHEWMVLCGFSQKIAHMLVSGLSDTKLLEQELHLIERHNVRWITVFDKAYPSLLRHIHFPPAVLYWYGGEFQDTKKHIAIVGSRASSVYGERVVNTLVPDLVSAGVVIVSGGALGIDAHAHNATINSRGQTIVVLGSGLLRMYPSTNKMLFKNIIDTGGLIVSSFSLLSEPKPGNFPSRNRIIAGLSHGTVVVQAAQKSGALITAHYALEQGREVFAVPGPFDDPLSVGCHELIQQGAQLVMSATDIVKECALVKSAVRDVQTTMYEAQQSIACNHVLAHDHDTRYSDNQKKIRHACQKPASLDDIMNVTGFNITLVQSELFAMQLDGIIEQDFMGMWTAQ